MSYRAAGTGRGDWPLPSGRTSPAGPMVSARRWSRCRAIGARPAYDRGDAPTITLTEAINNLCRLMGCESPYDMVLPKWRKKMGDFQHFAFRYYVWQHLKGKDLRKDER